MSWDVLASGCRQDSAYLWGLASTSLHTLAIPFSPLQLLSMAPGNEEPPQGSVCACAHASWLGQPWLGHQSHGRRNLSCQSPRHDCEVSGMWRRSIGGKLLDCAGRFGGLHLRCGDTCCLTVNTPLGKVTTMLLEPRGFCFFPVHLWPAISFVPSGAVSWIQDASCSSSSCLLTTVFACSLAKLHIWEDQQKWISMDLIGLALWPHCVWLLPMLLPPQCSAHFQGWYELWHMWVHALVISHWGSGRRVCIGPWSVWITSLLVVSSPYRLLFTTCHFWSFY